MTFLNPLAGIVAGAIAGPVLILLYFLKLRRRPVRVSSTLLWERAVEDLQVNEPFRWLRPSWLLFIQMLALASLCLALARPALDAGEAPPDRAVLLIDASASMNARDADGGRPRFDEARARAREVVNRLAEVGGSAFEGAVIAVAAEPRALTGLTPAAADLRAAIDSVEPTDQPGDLAAALRLARSLTQRAAEAPGDTRFIVIGDGGAGPVEAPAQGVRFIRVGPAPDQPKDNVGVAALAVRRDLDDASTVRVFARLVNAAPEPVRTAVTLLMDGSAIETRTVTIPGSNDDGPGESAVTFEFADAPSGEPRLATVFVERDDALAADNAASARLEPALPPRVLIVVPPEMTDAQRLAVSLLAGAPAAVGSTVVDTIDSAGFDAALGAPESLARYDLIILAGTRVAERPPIPTIEFGAGVGDAEPRVSAGPLRAASWRRSHPLLRQVALDGLVVAQAVSLALPETGTPGVTAEEVAAGPDGPLIVELNDRGVRRALVAFDLAQSNWPTQPGFVIFMVNAIERLTRLIGEATATAYTTTEPVTVRPAPGAPSVRVRGPIEFSRPVARGAAGVELGVLPRAGAYTVEGAAEGDRLIPVNLVSAAESAIATADALDLAGGPASTAGVGVAAPREIWRWFALAGFVLLTVEWLLYAWRMRV
ncbi:MAG: VWA domain-containing protein [Planctomycetota bacterium]|nr:MAG: VWA domain-containing protein [Planctomycetota bacterium]